MQHLLVMQNITKSFGGSKALKDGCIEVDKGQIHALIGANGAGKSTLMNILYGLCRKDSGSIIFDGKECSFKNIHKANSAGIFMIHQELTVAGDLTIAQSIFLGREPRKGIRINEKAMKEETEKLLVMVGVDEHPDSLMKFLSPAEQQLVQIAAVLSRQVRLIILDEPTTALGEEDVKTLFSIMRSLKEKGISMIYISHRLDELFEISDRITVMRDGAFVISEKTADITKDKLIYHMTGREVKLTAKEKSNIKDDAPVVLNVKNLCTNKLKDVSFSLRKGEILGFTGLMGCGRTEVARAVCGLDKISSGSIEINGNSLKNGNSVEASRYKAGYVSENREQEGLFKGKNIAFNTAIGALSDYRKGIALDDNAILDDSEKFNTIVKTKCSSFASHIENLSGGNRQKVIISRCLMSNLDIFVLDEPTKGIDVGAKEDIYETVKNLAKEGRSIIVTSSENDEIRNLCDRVLVMYEGAVSGELMAGNISNDNIMRLAAGANTASKDARG